MRPRPKNSRIETERLSSTRPGRILAPESGRSCVQLYPSARLVRPQGTLDLRLCEVRPSCPRSRRLRHLVLPDSRGAVPGGGEITSLSCRTKRGWHSTVILHLNHYSGTSRTKIRSRCL